MSRLHILEGWNSFRAAVLPADAGQVQLTEMRRAFYAGAVTVLSKMSELSTPDVSLDDGAAVLEEMHQECRHFKTRVLGGSA